LEILDIKTNRRKGFSDILVDNPDEKIMDIIISHIMDSEKVVTLQLKNKLIFTIIPIPVS
jgi:hypothetical protein